MFTGGYLHHCRVVLVLIFVGVATPTFAQIDIGPIHIPTPIPPPIPCCNPPTPIPVPGLPNPANPNLGNVAQNIVNGAAAPAVQVTGVITGQQTVGAAAQNIVGSQGQILSSVGNAVAQTNAIATNAAVTAASKIGGNTGKTVVTFMTGAGRVSVDFAATSIITTGGILQGQTPAVAAIASPLAAAIRSAENQYAQDPNARAIPADVKARLAGSYPADVLDNARYMVNTLSLSLPDLTNLAQKTFQRADNAVTVGHVTVFAVDPGTDYHWWAHELQHQVQYKNWGIDTFALKYVTSCHDVESDAEDKAQQVVPLNGKISLLC
jgi:hypothetical protein